MYVYNALSTPFIKRKILHIPYAAKASDLCVCVLLRLRDSTVNRYYCVYKADSAVRVPLIVRESLRTIIVSGLSWSSSWNKAD